MFYKVWRYFVDVYSVIWVILFILTFPSLNIYHSETVSNYNNYFSLIVSIVDILVNYKRVNDVDMFLRKHWSTILFAIPFLRFLRLIRVIRVLKLVINLGKFKFIFRYKHISILEKIFKMYRKVRKMINDFTEV